jgi:hypothetical protein
VLATVRIAYSLTLALAREQFGGLDAQVTEGMGKRKWDGRVLSRVTPGLPGLPGRVAGCYCIIEVSNDIRHS